MHLYTGIRIMDLAVEKQPFFCCATTTLVRSSSKTYIYFDHCAWVLLLLQYSLQWHLHILYDISRKYIYYLLVTEHWNSVRVTYYTINLIITKEGINGSGWDPQKSNTRINQCLEEHNGFACTVPYCTRFLQFCCSSLIRWDIFIVICFFWTAQGTNSVILRYFLDFGIT